MSWSVSVTCSSAQVFIEWWRQHYNTKLVHSELCYPPLAPEALQPSEVASPEPQQPSQGWRARTAATNLKTDADTGSKAVALPKQSVKCPGGTGNLITSIAL